MPAGCPHRQGSTHPSSSPCVKTNCPPYLPPIPALPLTAIPPPPHTNDSNATDAIAIAGTGQAQAQSQAQSQAQVLPPPPPRETVYVLTTPGPTRVIIVGDRGVAGDEAGSCADVGDGVAVGGQSGVRARRVSVVTLHAAGHNHRTCFGALERAVAKDEELGGGGAGAGGVVFYHVDAPGHEEEGDGVE